MMGRSHRCIRGVIALTLAASGEAASAQIPPLNVETVGHWDEHPSSYTAADLWADQLGFAYVCNRFGPTIDVMDVSDPANPSLVTIYTVGPPNQFTHAKEVKVAGGLMFIGLDDDGHDGVEVVDVRDPPNPRFLVHITIPGYEDVHNLFCDSGYLYLATSDGPKFAVVDLTGFDPDNPPAQTITQAKWLMTNVGNSIVHDITVQNGRAYVSAWDSGIRVYDVANVGTQPPVFLASAPGNNTHSAWPTNDRRWIVTNEERSNGGGVKLYEMMESGNSAAMAFRFEFTIPLSEARSSHNVYVVGYRAYCAWYNRGLMAFDIDPVHKTLVLKAHFDTSGNTQTFHGAWGVFPFFGRDRVMVSDKETQFWIFDVRIPGSADFDGDADVDLHDFSDSLSCVTGPGGTYSDPACEVFDVDGDLDVDMIDFSGLQLSFTGPR